MGREVALDFVANSQGVDKEVDNIESRLGGLATLTGGLFLGAGAAGGAALTSGFLEAMEREGLEDKFAAALNIDSTQAEQFITSSANVFKGAWGESIEEVATTMAFVSQSSFGDVASGELEELTNQAYGLAEAFDVDVTQSIETVSQLVAEGLVDDGAEGFDNLVASLQSVTPEMRDELFELSKEYDTHFADMGLSGQEMFDVFVEASSSGAIGMDRYGDALKELTIRGTDMSESSMEAYEAMGLSGEEMAASFLAGGDKAASALQATMTGLRSIEDPAAQAGAAIALFGTPVEDLGTAGIPEFISVLTNAGDSLNVVKGSSAALAIEIGDNLSTRMTALKREGMEKLANFATEHLLPAFLRFEEWSRKNWPLIQGYLESVTTWVKEVGWPIFQDFVSGMVTTGQFLVEKFKEYWPGIQDTIETVVVWFRDEAWPIIDNVIDFIVEAFEHLVGLAEEHWPQIERIIFSAITAVEETVKTFIEIVTFIWDKFGSDIMNYVTTIWGNIEKSIGLALDLIESAIQTFIGIVTLDWDTFWSGLSGMFSAGWGLFKVAFDNAIALFELAWSVAWEGIKLAFNAVWNGIKDYPRDKINELISWFSSVDMRQGAVDMFTKFKDGLISVVSAIPGILIDKILGPLDDIARKATELLGIASEGGIGDGFSGAIGGYIAENTNTSGNNGAILAAIVSSGNPYVNGSGGIFHDGGWVDSAGSSGRFDMASNLPLKSDERIGILQTEEFVLSRKMIANLENGDSSVGNGSPSGMQSLIGVMNVTEREDLNDKINLAYAIYGQGSN